MAREWSCRYGTQLARSALGQSHRRMSSKLILFLMSDVNICVILLSPLVPWHCYLGIMSFVYKSATPVPIGPASVRRRFAVETSRPAALVDLQSAWRPSVSTCYCRRSFVCCCRPATLEQSTCRRPVCPVTYNISSETEKLLVSAIVSRHCFLTASP